jgi:hypothetical protein
MEELTRADFIRLHRRKWIHGRKAKRKDGSKEKGRHESFKGECQAWFTKETEREGGGEREREEEEEGKE